jgi:hypothetical protein
MQLDRKSVAAGFQAGQRRMLGELKALTANYAELLAGYHELNARLEAALSGLRETRLRALHNESLVERDREQRAQIARLRQLTLAQMAVREADTLLN